MLRENSSYLVAGNVGTLDAAIAKYLTKLGAHRLIVCQGSGIEAVADDIRKLGTDVAVIPGNASSQPFMDQLRDASAGVPIRGIILGDVDVQDTDLRFLNYADWSAAIEPTTTGIISLQEAFGANLDFFLLLNRTSSVVGGPEQSIADAIGAFRDSFARSQALLGFPVKAIDIGTVQKDESDDVNGDVSSPPLAPDVRSQTVEEVLAVINYAMQNPVAESPAQGQIVLGASQFTPDASSSSSTPTQRPDARFAHVWSRAAPRAAKSGDDDEFDVQAALRSVPDADAAVQAVYTGLKQKLARLLAVPTKEIQPDRSVSSYGVDSLISVELRNWITGHLGGHVQMLELMSSMTMIQLAEVIAKRSRLVPASVFGGAEKA